MGITKLMHMKESAGTPHRYLENSIRYILNPEKTRDGALTGGNAGTDPKEALQSFLETKEFFGKTDGRQGYHFVISFAQGETDPETALCVIREFCEEFLGDAYDYVYSVHDDKQHVHGHIVFNSVSRTDGFKYHYSNGDWAKLVQPVTDEVCGRHGLKPLSFSGTRAGKSYAAWASEKTTGFSWKDIIRADIDHAVRKAKDYGDFLGILKLMGYSAGRDGVTHGRAYISLTAPGMKRAWRTTKLGEGYSLDEIKERIRHRTPAPEAGDELMKLMNAAAGNRITAAYAGGTRTHARLYQAASYWKLPNPYAVPQARVRKDMTRIRELIEDCRYMEDHGCQTPAEIRARAKALGKRMAEVKVERNTLYGGMRMDTPDVRKAREEWKAARKELEAARTDAAAEAAEEKIADIESRYPQELLFLPARLAENKKEYLALRKEERILERLMRTETGAEPEARKPAAGPAPQKTTGEKPGNVPESGTFFTGQKEAPHGGAGERKEEQAWTGKEEPSSLTKTP